MIVCAGLHLRVIHGILLSTRSCALSPSGVGHGTVNNIQMFIGGFLPERAVAVPCEQGQPSYAAGGDAIAPQRLAIADPHSVGSDQTLSSCTCVWRRGTRMRSPVINVWRPVRTRLGRRERFEADNLEDLRPARHLDPSCFKVWP